MAETSVTAEGAVTSFENSLSELDDIENPLGFNCGAGSRGSSTSSGLVEANESMAQLNRIAKFGLYSWHELPTPLRGLVPCMKALCHLSCQLTWIFMMFVFAENSWDDHLKALCGLSTIVSSASQTCNYPSLYRAWVAAEEGEPTVMKMRKLLVTEQGKNDLEQISKRRVNEMYRSQLLAVGVPYILWSLEFSDCPIWVYFLAWFTMGFLNAPMIECGLATTAVCPAIVCDQLRQFTTSLNSLERQKSSTPTSSQPQLPWDFKTAMIRLDSLFHELIPLCERCINRSVLFGCCENLCGGLCLTYVGATWQGSLVTKIVFQGLAVIFYQAAYQYFLGPLSIVSAIEDLIMAVNRLRVILPLEHSMEVVQMLDYLRDQNALSGPGYVFGGQLITKRLLWNIAGSLVALSVGSLASSM